MSYDLMLQEALKFHHQGNLDAAEHIYRQILQTTPNNSQVQNLLGLLAQSKGLHHQAIELFSSAILQNNQSAELYFNLGWSLQSLGKNNEAIETYNKALLWQKDIKEAHNAIGKIYFEENQINKAIVEFDKAIAIDANYAEAKANLAKASNDIEKLLLLAKEYPNEPLIPYYISLFYRDIKDNQKALEFAHLADELIPDEKIKLLIAELENNQDYYKQALSINPNSVNAMINLANFETDINKAETLYKKAIDIAANDLDAHLNYGNFLYHQNRKLEALEEYHRAIVIDPEKAETSNSLGLISRDVGEYEEALGLFFNAFIKNQEQSEYALNIAETLSLLNQQNPKLAKKIAKNWLKIAPNNIFAQHSFASIEGKNINSQKYSEELFNLFAQNYEDVMQKIEYSLPEFIKQNIGLVSGTIIDLGCGTGLVGQAIKNDENLLIGVDISAAMLEKAAQKNIYAKLVQDDITHYSQTIIDNQMVIMADVLGYIDNIEPIIKNLQNCNICFSIAKNNKCRDFCLNASGRYQHNPDYIKKLLNKYGYTDIISKEFKLRHQQNQDSQGVLFIAKKD